MGCYANWSNRFIFLAGVKCQIRRAAFSANVPLCYECGGGGGGIVSLTSRPLLLVTVPPVSRDLPESRSPVLRLLICFVVKWCQNLRNFLESERWTSSRYNAALQETRHGPDAGTLPFIANCDAQIKSKTVSYIQYSPCHHHGLSP